MNVENMLKVADEIEQHPEHFDMALPHRPDYSCETAGCIAGYCKLFGPTTVYKSAKYLELHDEEADQLFCGGAVWAKYSNELQITPFSDNSGCSYSSIKPHHAVTMLRNLASGKWSF